MKPIARSVTHPAFKTDLFILTTEKVAKGHQTQESRSIVPSLTEKKLRTQSQSAKLAKDRARWISLLIVAGNSALQHSLPIHCGLRPHTLAEGIEKRSF